MHEKMTIGPICHGKLADWTKDVGLYLLCNKLGVDIYAQSMSLYKDNYKVT